MTANLELTPLKENSSLRGFTNLYRKEHQSWWRTRLWWINALLWTGLFSGLTVLLAFIVPTLSAAAGDPNVIAGGGPVAFGLDLGRRVYFEMGSMTIALGVIILSQDLILAEEQSGLTEWLLAKPVARRSYILAKFSATLLPVTSLALGLPALSSYLLLGLRAGEPISLAPFLGGVLIMLVHTIFYLCLTLLLGTAFPSRAPILGVALGILLCGNLIIGVVPFLAYITPWSLVKTASLLAASVPLPASMVWLPPASTLLWSAVFLIIAVARFERTEY